MSPRSITQKAKKHFALLYLAKQEGFLCEIWVACRPQAAEHSGVSRNALGRGLGVLMDRSADRGSVRLERPAAPLTPALSDLLSRGTSPAAISRTGLQNGSKPALSGEAAKLTRPMAFRLSFALIAADVALVSLGMLMAVRTPSALPGWMGSLIGATAVLLGAWLAWLALWVRGLSRP